ncbi:MAG: CapA family protein, partial [Clostridiaceae bacterium]|nr:CapA family protein [Clostridiaceae bacterium]
MVQEMIEAVKKYLMLGLISLMVMVSEQPKQSEESIKIVLGGDVLLDRSVGWIIDNQGSDSIWGDVRSILSDADISMVNLENPLSRRGSMEKDKQFIFRGKPQYVKALESAGIDIVSLANNHVLDYGEIALLDRPWRRQAPGAFCGFRQPAPEPGGWS